MITPKRFFFALCIALAVILIGGGSAYYYFQKSLAAKITVVANKEAKSQAQDDTISKLEDLRNQYNHLSAGPSPLLPLINEALPATKNESEIAIQLHTMAVQNGLAFSGLTFPASDVPSALSQTVKVGNVLALPISFKLTGTYAQLQGFLLQQESLSRYTDITGLTITSNGASANTQLLSYDITLNAYVKE